jgi:hypothetical protein
MGFIRENAEKPDPTGLGVRETLLRASASADMSVPRLTTLRDAQKSGDRAEPSSDSRTTL